MKSAPTPTGFSTLLPSFACFAYLLGIASSAAVDDPALTARQDTAWLFYAYQSHEVCTGETDPYSGAGSQDCTQGILNGSFGSFIRGDIQEGCSIYLYNNADCSLDGIVDVITSETPQQCLQPDIELVDVQSFDVICE